MILLARGYGFADLDADRRAAATTNYRLASITKQFTAAAVLLLAEDGRLSLDDRVRTWLPELPEALDAVRLHHLLAYTSGILDYEELMAPDYALQSWPAGSDAAERKQRLFDDRMLQRALVRLAA